MPHSKNFKDMTGVKIHRLTFLEFVDTTENECARWKVRCDCGETFIAIANNILYGSTRSCGCYRNEQNRKRYQQL